MRYLLFFFILLPAVTFSQRLPTVFEASGGARTPTYAQAIAWWKVADAASPLITMEEAGPTDAGYPLHLVWISADGKKPNPDRYRREGKTLIFVLNGIHSGEPDGIDASILLAKDIALGKLRLPASVVLAIVPVYNIGGALNRSDRYRVDQAGPDSFGFRGNSQNLDLNRDFIKADSREAGSFARLFHRIQPDIFIDNHVSNGADYQHVMTLLSTQHNKLGGAAGAHLEKQLEPALYNNMQSRGFTMVPYVNHFGETPDKGWPQFWDSPRYSSGFAALFHTFAFVPETHMLKPYPQRVAATKALLESFVEYAANNGAALKAARSATEKEYIAGAEAPIHWKRDTAANRKIRFLGYASGRKLSEISGKSRLYYDRSQPYEKEVPFYNQYEADTWVTVPKAYLIPQGWWRVIERLQAAGVPVQRLQRDTSIIVERYRILSYTASPRPYEGHHPNSNVKLQRETDTVTFRKGDCYIPLTGRHNRFLVETLEPDAEDSYFAWNFFDAILQQKEGYSDYVFEETAAAVLKSYPALQALLEDRRAKDSVFAANGAAQLDFIYRHSKFYEGAHMQYPVYRIAVQTMGTRDAARKD